MCFLKIKIPLHVSGLWIPSISSSYLETGSYGAGLNLAMYIEAGIVDDGGCGIYINNARVLREQSMEICNNTGTSISVNAYSPVSLGRGFGISAGLLIAHALASYHALKYSSMKALQLAHVLEVKYLTGLGDVLSEYTGGFAIRLKPGAPGVGIAHRVVVFEKPVLIVGELSSGESTQVMLSRITSELYEVAFSYYKKLVESEDLLDFFNYSQLFTRKVFDYSVVDKILSDRKGIISYYLKKSALIIWVEKEYASEIHELLNSNGIKAFETTISDGGVMIEHPG
ncbi:pantoate kinase [Desulfurococcus amylolyticus]|uniref:pantoate kinase n=1 Tax=Desulfurococcus amylolyticus TaxID=94694 RepID=UPI001F1E60DC|nr:kinase [Desulfurococcus amylolyticus]